MVLVSPSLVILSSPTVLAELELLDNDELEEEVDELDEDLKSTSKNRLSVEL